MVLPGDKLTVNDNNHILNWTFNVLVLQISILIFYKLNSSSKLLKKLLKFDYFVMNINRGIIFLSNLPACKIVLLGGKLHYLRVK